MEVTAEDGETTQSYRLVLRKTDEAAPVITPAAADRTGVSTADIRFSADELSSYYYAVVESGRRRLRQSTPPAREPPALIRRPFSPSPI